MFSKTATLRCTSTLSLSLLALALPGVAQSQAKPGLSFEVNARFSTPTVGMGAQNVSAKVLISGQKARVETGTGRAKTLLLYSPPKVARLLPASKVGVLWQVKPKAADFRDFDPQQLLREPGRIRAALLQNGAKKTGSGLLDSTPVDIYQVQRPGQEAAKVWLRRSDALPLRLEAKSKGVNVVAVWKNYVRFKTVSPALFQIPAGFKVRALKGAPPLAGL